MEADRSSAPSSKPATTHSCQRCAVRKIRCDKQQPCAACVKADARCEPRVVRPPRRKRGLNRNEILSGRLAQYEKLLQQKDVGPVGLTRTPGHNASSLTTNGTVSTTKERSPSQAPDVPPAQPLGVGSRPQLLHDKGRSKYIDNGLWTKLVEELAEPADAIGHSSDEDGDEDDAAQDNTDFVLGPTPSSITVDSSHPPGDQILGLWHVFLENVDPLTKLVHGPSLQRAIQKAAVESSSVSKSLDALFFAIYSAAVVSLRNTDCERRFGEPRKALLLRYRLATKAALSRAKFMSSADLTVLQAFLIHLLSMREVYDSRTLWTLTGVALRMAEGMGLHRDGSVLGLPPFETEMRRRVWWQLKLLDGDMAQLTGFEKFGNFDTDPKSTKLPSNINDDDLYPGMSSPPVPTTNGATDMVFCALRYELRNYWIVYLVEKRQKGETDNFWNGPWSDGAMTERDKDIDEFERVLETKYIRYCDPSAPIQLMSSLIARAAVGTTRLIAHHPRRWASECQIPDSERHYVWNLSIKTLKQYNMIHSNRELARFSWHSAFYFRWQAFIHILDTLRVNPLMHEAVQVWQLIDEVYETNPDLATNTKKPLYVAVGNLCLKAYEAREAAAAKENKPTILPTTETPSYISTFRRRRDIAAARRKTRKAAENPPNTDKDKQAIHANTLPAQQQQPPQQPEPSGRPEPLVSTFPESSAANMDMDFDMDFDFHLFSALDASLEDTMSHSIDWAKWDALIGDLN